MADDDKSNARSAAWGVATLLLGTGAGIAWAAATQRHAGLLPWIFFSIFTLATLAAHRTGASDSISMSR